MRDKERILVTGGAGFIGRALVAHCVDARHSVTVIDNLCTGRREHLDLFNTVNFHEADILDTAELNRLVALANPSVVFHLAAHHFIPFCDAHPRETLDVNVGGTYAVLDAAARAGARLAVVASSGAFYPSLPITLQEDIEPAPTDVYGLSKQVTESVCSFFAKNSNLTCIAVRLFNTYGPYETNQHLIPHILDSLKRSGIVALGNIHTKRDYIYVGDVADALYRIAEVGGKGFFVVNLGTGYEYSAGEIVNEISDILGMSIDVVNDPRRIRRVDKLNQRADLRRLNALIGLTNFAPLAVGLQKLLSNEGLC